MNGKQFVYTHYSTLNDEVKIKRLSPKIKENPHKRCSNIEGLNEGEALRQVVVLPTYLRTL